MGCYRMCTCRRRTFESPLTDRMCFATRKRQTLIWRTNSPLLRRAIWSFWLNRRKPGILLANSTTYFTPSVSLSAQYFHISSIAWGGRRGQHTAECRQHYCIHHFNIAAGKCEANLNWFIFYILLYILMGRLWISPWGPIKPCWYNNITMYLLITFCIVTFNLKSNS